MDGVIGIDLAGGEDYTGLYGKIDGCTYVCFLPRGLGYVTSIEVRNGRVVASTDTGIKMIVAAERK